MMLSAEIGRAVGTWFNTTIKFIIVFAVSTISKTRVYNCLGPALKMLSRGLFIAFFGLGFPWLRPQVTWALSHVQSVLGVSRSLLRWRPKKDAPRAVLALLEGVVPLITHWWSTAPQARVLGQGKVIYYEVDGPIMLFIYTMRHHVHFQNQLLNYPKEVQHWKMYQTRREEMDLLYTPLLNN